MKTKNVLKLILLVAVLCIAGSWYYFEIYSKQKTPIENGDNSGIIQEETLVSGETISSGIREMGELNTAEYYFSRTENVENTKQLDLTSLGIDFKADIPLTTNSFTYSYDGEIKAGIDFTQVTVEVDNETKTITVKLPETKITSSEIDPDSYKLYSVTNNILNPISPDDFALSLSDLIHTEEERAIEKGLLQKAQKNAEVLIRNFVKSYAEGYKITIGR